MSSLPILRLTEGEKTYGERKLLRLAEFRLAQGERAVLIGPNGAGKTTLFRILAGGEKADAGLVERYGSLHYLPQDYRPTSGTVYELAYRSTPLFAAEQALETAEPELAGAAWERVNALSFWKGYVAKTLSVFGLQRELWQQDVKGLSGGEGVRMGLALAFLSGADALLLDEPTTHLDLKMRLRLEQLIASYPGAVALISHDRTLIGKVANVVYHLEAAQLIRVPGSYANYLQERERIKRTIEKARREADKERERLLGSAESMRWMAPSSQKKARQREQLIVRAERIQAPDPLPPERRWSLEIAAEGTPKLVLEAKGLVKGYVVEGRGSRVEGQAIKSRGAGEQGGRGEKDRRGDKETGRQGEKESVGAQFIAPDQTKSSSDSLQSTSHEPPATREVIRNATLRIFRGDRIALIGPNGAGKTTLLRLLLGREWPDGGERELGLGVSVGFLDQHHHGLEPAEPLYDQFVKRFGEARAAVLLGRMRFKPPHWFDVPSSFSGGERSRAGLALLSGLRTGLLVLDEPTNHLEVELLEALERALTDYPGTLLFVSHDRTLVQKVATRYWGLENGILVEYPSYAQAEAAMLGKPAQRLNPFGDVEIEEEKPLEERDLEAERLTLLDRLNSPGFSEREYGRIRSDLFSVEELLYQQYAGEYYRPFAYRHRIKQQGWEIYADEEAGFWRFWLGYPTSLKNPSKADLAFVLTGGQHGKSFVLEGQVPKRMLKGVLRILFELEDAQVIRHGKSVYGRNQYLKVKTAGRGRREAGR